MSELYPDHASRPAAELRVTPATPPPAESFKPTTWQPKTWREWASAAWVAYWDCYDGRERLIHSDLRDAVEDHVDDSLAPDCDVAAVVREQWPDGLTVYGWERKEVTLLWLHHTADELAERFEREFDGEFGGGDDRCLNKQLEAEIARGFEKALHSVREKLVPWQCEQVAEVTLTVEEVLEVLGVKTEVTP